MKSEAELKKSGRGSYHESLACQSGVSMHAVRWFDNRCVTFMSPFSSANPISKVKQYDRKKKVEVECPNIVATYNRCMGGVDLFD